MQNRITLIGILLLSIFSNTLIAQESRTTTRKELTIGAGVSLMSITDRRMSAITYDSWQATYHMGYKSQSEKTTQELQFDLTMNQKRGTTRFLDLSFIKPSFSYSLEKKVKDVWLGGVFNSTTLLTMPKTRTGHFSNNPISYTLANTIGPKVSYRRMFNMEQKDSRIELNTSIETALLGYVVRPAFGHPYPERYLESGTFSPTKSGMAGPLLSSGKMMSINKFQSFKVVLGLSYYVRDNIKIGLRLSADYHNVSNSKSARMMAKELILTTSYLY